MDIRLVTIIALILQVGGQETLETTTQSEKEVEPTKCYDDWGCINMGKPFVSMYRPLNLNPLHPDTLDVRLFLRTRKNPDTAKPLSTNASQLIESPFSSNSPTVFIIHGYLEHGQQKWIKDMSRELLTRKDQNIISVDWALGASPPYTQAAANTRTVAIVMADYINQLQGQFEISPENLHLIGHSLGAHIAGYVGERTPDLGRITGLDPAEPYFQWTDPEVRLDPTDAQFVDVIHTDGGSIMVGGLGMIQDCGHVDFYPNGGKRQPGCHSNRIGPFNKEGDFLYGIRRLISCNHIRAYELFTESIRTECPFYGFECDDYSNFTSGRCLPDCGEREVEGGCAHMGFRANEWKPYADSEKSKKMFLETGNEEPFCRFHYQLNFTFSSGINDNEHSHERGRLFIRITGTRGQSQILEANRDHINFEPGSNLQFLVTTPDLGELLRLDLEWKSSSSLLNPLSWRLFDAPEIWVNDIEIHNLESSRKTVFKGSKEPLKSQQIKTLFSDSDYFP